MPSAATALKVDIDRNSELQSKYSIIGPPTLMFFGADGLEKTDLRLSGAVGPEEVLEAIEKIVSTTENEYHWIDQGYRVHCPRCLAKPE